MRVWLARVEGGGGVKPTVRLIDSSTDCLCVCLSVCLSVCVCVCVCVCLCVSVCVDMLTVAVFVINQCMAGGVWWVSMV